MFLISLIALMLIIILTIFTGGRTAFIILIPFHLIFGWALHGWKALPPFLEKWETALLPAGSVILAGILLHRFILRWAKEKRHLLEWRKGHTAAVMSLLLLCSAAAIAASGIVHQFFWLAGGKVIESNTKTDVIKAMINGRQVMLVIREFYVDKGRYPESFGELEGEYGVPRDLWWVETGEGEVPEPFVFLRPGATEIAQDRDALIVSPPLRGGTIRMVGYGDNSVSVMNANRFSDIYVRKAKWAGDDE